MSRAALKEYEAQDRLLHELLERVRVASYAHAPQAVQQPDNWRFANELAAVNSHLQRALRALGGEA